MSDELNRVKRRGINNNSKQINDLINNRNSHMPLLDFITSAISPITNLIDDLTTSDEEKLQLKNELSKIHNEIQSKVLDYESRLIDAKSKIIIAESQGESWLQRNWRPLLMISIIAIVVNNYILFPYIHAFTDKVQILELPQGLWTLLVTGVGGYIIGRSGEKNC